MSRLTIYAIAGTSGSGGVVPVDQWAAALDAAIQTLQVTIAQGGNVGQAMGQMKSAWTQVKQVWTYDCVFDYERNTLNTPNLKKQALDAIEAVTMRESHG